MIMKFNAFTNQTKSSKKTCYQLYAKVIFYYILLNILKNPWFTLLPSQIMAVLFPQALLIALRNKSHIIKVT